MRVASCAVALGSAVVWACGGGASSPDAALEASAPDAGSEAGPVDAFVPGSDAGGDAAPPDAGRDAGPADGGTIPMAPEVQAFIDALCANEVRCANRASPFIDADWCHPAWLGERPDLWSAGLAAGRLAAGATYDDCLSSLETVCADLLDPECLMPFDGLVAEDDDCFADGECQGGLVCLSEGTCPRTCRPPRAEGDLCGALGSCGPDRYCPIHFGSTWSDTHCIAYDEVGEPCDSVIDCRAGAYCDSGDGTCRPESGEGEPCEPTSGVFSPECALRLVCIPDDAGITRCTAPADLTEGDPCSYSLGDPCPFDLVCGGVGTKTCMPGAAVGDDCGGGVRCTSSSRCVLGACVSVSAPGEPCGEDAVCTSEHYCDDTGHCRREPVGGEPCEEGISCTDLSYCDVSARVCHPRGSPGDACGGSTTRCLSECDYDAYECAPLYEEGDLCHYVGRECAPGLECREDAEGRSRCQPVCRP